MSENLIKSLLNSITLIPGIVGIADLDFSKSPLKLTEDSWIKGVEIKKIDVGYEISTAIVVDKDINAKIIAKQLGALIAQLIVEEFGKKAKLNIYVRGIE